MTKVPLTDTTDPTNHDTEAQEDHPLRSFIESLKAAGVAVNVEMVEGRETLHLTGGVFDEVRDSQQPYRDPDNPPNFRVWFQTDDQEAAIANCVTALVACLRVPPAGREVVRESIATFIAVLRTGWEGTDVVTDRPDAHQS